MAVEHEAQAVTNNYEELVKGIKHSVDYISDVCVGNCLITKETHTKIFEIPSIGKKTRVLLDNVSTTIEMKSQFFEVFATILENEESTKHLGMNLRSELKSLEDRATITQTENSVDGSIENVFHPDDLTDDLTDEAAVPTGIEETQPEGKTHLRRRKIVSTFTSKKPMNQILYDNGIKELNNVIETLLYAKLDSQEKESQVRALREGMKSVKEENRALEQEKKDYCNTIHELEDLLRQKDAELKEKKELECKLSDTEKQKYKEIQMKETFEQQVQDLQHENTILSKTLHEKEVLLHDLTEIQQLLQETKERCNELETLEAKYEKVREELLELMHMQSQEERRSFLKCLCYACLIIAVVIAFFLIIISMAYCLEDKENHNLKQCAQTVISTTLEYLFTHT